MVGLVLARALMRRCGICVASVLRCRSAQTTIASSKATLSLCRLPQESATNADQPLSSRNVHTGRTPAAAGNVMTG